MVSVSQLQVAQLAKIVDSSWPPVPPQCPLVTLCDPHTVYERYDFFHIGRYR